MSKVKRQRPAAQSGLQADVEALNTGPASQHASEPASEPASKQASQHASEPDWEQLGTYIPSGLAWELRVHVARERVQVREVVTAALRAYLDEAET